MAISPAVKLTWEFGKIKTSKIKQRIEENTDQINPRPEVPDLQKTTETTERCIKQRERNLETNIFPLIFLWKHMDYINLELDMTYIV